ncbi:MAG: hypothetical protein K6A72_03685 [Lachnospiraceae bacterium]|nr:hypothetical protein [Lachnospiraceae bacterium]
MKYIIFTGEKKNKLFGQLMSDLKGCADVILVPDVPQAPAALEWLWKIHHNRTVSEKVMLPFRGIWNGCMPYDEAGLNEECCLIFNNVSIEYFEPGLLKKWKKKYGIKLVLYMLDVWDSYYSKGVRIAMKYIPFDRVYTFYQTDAEKYGFRYFDCYYSEQKNVKKNSEQTDMYFWGTDAGRRPMIEAAVARVQELGYRTKTGICFTDEKDSPMDGVIYNQPKEYEDVISDVISTDVLLDIVGEYSKGVSLRYYEAFAYGKKLISNNLLVKSMRGFNSNRVLYFDDPKDIRRDFFEKEIDIKYDGCFSPVNWIRELTCFFEKK